MSEAKTQIRKADLSDERATLELTWGDAHASTYPLRYLRAECPCASCRTEREEARNNPFRMVTGTPASYELVNIEPIGRYGLKLVWKDGHATGIYTFEYLREICPCDACKAQRTGQDVPFVHGIYLPK